MLCDIPKTFKFFFYLLNNRHHLSLSLRMEARRELFVSFSVTQHRRLYCNARILLHIDITIIAIINSRIITRSDAKIVL